MQQIGLEAELKGVPDFTAGIDKMNKAVDHFATDTAKGLDKATTLTQDAAGRWRTATGKFASDAEKAAAGVDTIGPAAKGAGAAVDQAASHFSAFGEIVTGALRKVGELGVQALMAAGRAIKDFVGDSIGLAGDFQANMLQFQSVAGKSVDTKGLEQFRDLFLDIGKRLPVSTSEVQMAAIEMVKGGIDPATIAAGGLEQNIQFAAAAMGGDLVKAAEISSKILGGWAGVNATAADKSLFLTHATDLLTKAANASSTDVEGLSRGIFQSQGIAKAAGIQFDDLVTTLAELAPRFGSSAEAGTSLKNLIARLQPTTANATAAMIDLGLVTENGKNKFFDATGTFIGFQKASELLKGSVEGLTDKQKTLELQMIFGNDAMSAASALSELGAAGYTDMAAALENANGVAAAAELKQQGFNTALDNAKGSVEALQITVGSFLLPVLTDLMNNVIAPAVNTLTDFASALFGSDEAFNRLSPTMQIVETVINALITDVQDIVGAFDEAGAKSSEFGESIGLLADHLGLPGQLIEDIIFAVQGLVAMFSSAGDQSSALGSELGKLNGVWDLALKTVQDVGAGYLAIANAVLPIIQKLWLDHGAQITAFVKTTFDTVIQIITIALKLYDAIVPPILNAIAGFFRDHASEIELILSGAGQAIGAIVTGTMDTLKGIFQLALDLIHGDWKAAWEDIQGIVDAQAKAIGGVVKGFLNIIAGIFNTSLADIGKTWSDNWNAMLDLVSKIGWWEAGKSVVEGLKKGIDDAWDSLLNWFNSKVSGLVDAAMAAIGAGSPATEFMPVGAYAIQGIMVGLESMVPALNDLIVQTGNDMIAALTKNIDEGGDAIRKQLEKLTEDIKSIASDINGAIADAFGATASVDRQKVANITAVAKLDPRYQAGVQSQINAAEQIARAMNDPKEAAAYFKMRSQQLIELGQLSQQINEATDMQQRAMLQAQYDLINDAQNAEMQQSAANAAGQVSVAQELRDRIAALFSGSDIADKLPGILESDLVKGIYGALDQLTSPVAAPSSYNGVGGISNFSQTTQYNMPIYTNMSPSAIQDSMAIAGAALL